MKRWSVYSQMLWDRNQTESEDKDCCRENEAW